MLSPQMQAIAMVCVPWLAHVISAKGWATSDQATAWLNDTVTFILNDLVPVAMTAWAAYRMSYSKIIKDVASQDSVAHVAMTTAADAASLGVTGRAPPDKILAPSEVIGAVAALPQVKAVVMESQVTADNHPANNVVGPQQVVIRS
jgi:hypothetical protein